MRVRELEPQEVWNHFEDLNQVPRASKKEERVRQFMKGFAQEHGLAFKEDEVGNVVVYKEGQGSGAGKAPVVLQAHLDMVHQKNNDTDFDFSSEGIRSVVMGDWVTAEGTTLGADNGMGVAFIMAILTDKGMDHPPIEALFTIDEETGMTGAKGLDSALVSGRMLINLDNEDDREVCIGCAGGIDTTATLQLERTPLQDQTVLSVELKGLKGGHSGMDIHLDRGNAHVLVARILDAAQQLGPVTIVEWNGGTLRNAIPREVRVVVSVPNGMVAEMEHAMSHATAAIREEYAHDLPEVQMSRTESQTPPVDADMTRRVISAVRAVPNGVHRMSPSVPGMVETSSSLAVISTTADQMVFKALQRSNRESGKVDIAGKIRSVFQLMGAQVVQDGDYPGWLPQSDSALLAKTVEQYERVFSHAPEVGGCHAGLECGILLEHMPGTEAVSIGPTITGAHSPDEQVNIPSVQRSYGFLKELLGSLS